jgi:hypothetical protein
MDRENSGYENFLVLPEIKNVSSHLNHSNNSSVKPRDSNKNSHKTSRLNSNFNLPSLDNK